MKDPAFLFYPGDWLGGTIGFSLHQKGAFLELLLLQFNNGPFSEEMAINLVGLETWNFLKKKFSASNKGYFNERLSLEKDKRSKFTESRRIARKNGYRNTNVSRTMLRMENENENENRIKLKGVDFEKLFERAFDDLTLTNYRMVFNQLDLRQELVEYKLKCDSEPEDYHNRDVAGLRKGFHYQCRNSKNKLKQKKNEIDYNQELRSIIEGTSI